jgi:hypothetical protein
MRPEYCMIPDEPLPGSEGPCRGCGATASGNDPVRGMCQARNTGYPPVALLDIVLIDKRTGNIVAST